MVNVIPAVTRARIWLPNESNEQGNQEQFRCIETPNDRNSLYHAIAVGLRLTGANLRLTDQEKGQPLFTVLRDRAVKWLKINQHSASVDRIIKFAHDQLARANHEPVNEQPLTPDQVGTFLDKAAEGNVSGTTAELYALSRIYEHVTFRLYEDIDGASTQNKPYNPKQNKTVFLLYRFHAYRFDALIPEPPAQKSFELSCLEERLAEWISLKERATRVESNQLDLLKTELEELEASLEEKTNALVVPLLNIHIRAHKREIRILESFCRDRLELCEPKINLTELAIKEIMIRDEENAAKRLDVIQANIRFEKAAPVSPLIEDAKTPSSPKEVAPAPKTVVDDIVAPPKPIPILGRPYVFCFEQWEYHYGPRPKGVSALTRYLTGAVLFFPLVALTILSLALLGIYALAHFSKKLCQRSPS